MKLISRLFVVLAAVFSALSFSKELELIPTEELVYWSSLGRIEIVQSLLDQGADPSTFDSGGYSALQAAAENNYLEIVKLLIGKGADINYKSQFTALDLAEMAGHKQVIDYLKAHGAK